MEEYNAEEKWNKTYLTQQNMAYPSEYVIRIFKGKYPTLNFNKNYNKKKICDLGCGDGRDIPLLEKCGFDVYGTEISSEIINKIKNNLKEKISNQVNLAVGNNEKIPFENNFFDYLLSWNSCYYMSNEGNFQKHVEEMYRILKPEGILVLSIPKKTCFIYKDSEIKNNGYCIIKNDPFKIRNGAILRIFENEDEIKKSFSEHFKNFTFASIYDDCFGLNYHWHLLICQKK